MIIRHLELVGDKVMGAVDLGQEIDLLEDSLDQATDAIVLMLNCINSRFKVTLGYFFIKSLTADQKHSLVKLCFEKLDSIGAKTVSLTCDGPATNVAMAKLMGVSMAVGNMKTMLIDRPIPTYIILDPVHMLKVRNQKRLKRTVLKEFNFVSFWLHFEC